MENKTGWIIDPITEDTVKVYAEYQMTTQTGEYIYKTQIGDEVYMVYDSGIHETEQDALEEFLCQVIQEENQWFLLKNKLTKRLAAFLHEDNQNEKMVG